MQTQMDFLETSQPTRRVVMLSLHPEYYAQICTGEKTHEYRRGVFMRTPVDAFVYCTSPVMQIGLFVQFGSPVIAPPHDIAMIRENGTPGTYQMMMDWMAGYDTATALPVERVITFDPISLSDIKAQFPDFHPPQKFIYVDKQKELLAFLKRRALLD